MRTTPQITTETIAESIVSNSEGVGTNGRPSTERVLIVKGKLDEIAVDLGYDKSYLLGDSTVKILDAYQAQLLTAARAS